MKNKNKLIEVYAFEKFTQMNSTQQISQHVGGGRGKRKTHIIKVIQHFFIKTNNEQKNCIVAYNANATLLVGGTTIHSLLGLSIKNHAIVNKSNSIFDIWPTIDL
jgi:hypothetical protein